MRGPMRVRRGFQGGRESAGDGIDNPYRVEGRLGAEPQVAAASQRQPGARIDKPYRLGADGGRGHAGTRANRWRAKAMSDAFAAMGVEGVVGRIRIDGGRGRCRTRSQRWGSRALSDAFASSRVVPSESTTTGSLPPGGGSQANVWREPHGGSVVSTSAGRTRCGCPITAKQNHGNTRQNAAFASPLRPARVHQPADAGRSPTQPGIRRFFGTLCGSGGAFKAGLKPQGTA